MAGNAASPVNINNPRLSLSNRPHTLNLDGSLVARFKSSIGTSRIARIHAFLGSTHALAETSSPVGRLLTNPGVCAWPAVNFDRNHLAPSPVISIVDVVGDALCPCSVITFPFTRTRPSAMRRSASRLLQSPRRDRILLTRSVSSSSASRPSNGSFDREVNPRFIARSYGLESVRPAVR